MKLSKIKSILNNINTVNFYLETGERVPEHFHITEVGQVNKNFIDCGGMIRNESVIVFQLWTADDYDHRLSAEKLKSIIALSESKLQLEDLDIVVEYQSDTIGKYDIEFKDNAFYLKNKFTDCLAKDSCIPPTGKKRVKLSSLRSDAGGCDPNSGCC